MTTLLALDIGGTKVGWGIVEVGQNSTVVERGSIPTEASRGGADVAERICSLASSLKEAHPEASGVAIASAGVVDPVEGKIVSATDIMPGWGGTPLGKLVAQRTGLPVRVLNDVHAHGLGEATLGAGRPYSSVLSIAVGTGIGGALVEDGHVAFGSRGIAGHVGHIHHHFAPDMVCSCGRLGHIEAFCSGSGIMAWYNSLRPQDAPEVDGGRALQELADAGDPLACACFSRSAYALGEATASLVNCVDPAAVIISGSMTRSGDIWWDGLNEGFSASAMTPVATTPILVGSLGGDAPLLGAVSFFLNA